MIQRSIYSRCGKRVFDLSISTVALVLLAPVYGVIACLVWLRLGLPILFCQKRPGLNGKPFTIYKFRTMTEASDASGQPLVDSKRLQPFGSWLRSTSLDELPELWNVIRGDMSLVGPRPLLTEYLSRYSNNQKRRHNVRPGITGLAQISGRNALSWKERFELDLKYVHQQSFSMDVCILFQTIAKVISRDGITSEGCTTGKPFEPESPLVVVGAGGHGKSVISVLLACGMTVEGVYDDDETLWGQTLLGVPVVGAINQLATIGQRRGVLAIGNNYQRAQFAEQLSLDWISAIHPSAIVHPSAKISTGTVVCAGAVIQPDCRVGSHSIVNTGATLDHDCELGNFVSIGPGSSLAGAVQVAELTMVGTGCAILPGITIGQRSCIGAGSTVIRDVGEGITAYGVPARVAKEDSNALSDGSWPHFDDEQIAAVDRVLRSGKVNAWTGEECKNFEQEFCAEFGVRHSIAVANGTVALELALYALKIGPGDEVIVPSRTFIASASAIVARGAKPVVADIDPESQTVTADTIKAVLTPRTKAVIAVHLAGWPCDMDSIMSLSQRHGFFVVEDCAQAHGARYKNQSVGSFGHINAFSFCQDKIMTTGGEGGMITTNDSVLWERAWSYKDHGKSQKAIGKSGPPGVFRFVHDSFGTNFRMTEMQAAIGRVQIRRLKEWALKRRQNANQIMQGLCDIEGINFPQPQLDIEHSYYRLYGFIQPNKLVDNWTRDQIICELLKRGVPIGSGSCGEIYLEKAFAPYRPAGRLANARLLQEGSLAFLVHPTLRPSDITHTIKQCRNIFTEAGLFSNLLAQYAA